MPHFPISISAIIIPTDTFVHWMINRPISKFINNKIHHPMSKRHLIIEMKNIRIIIEKFCIIVKFYIIKI